MTTPQQQHQLNKSNNITTEAVTNTRNDQNHPYLAIMTDDQVIFSAKGSFTLAKSNQQKRKRLL
jgi:hypothetical protein